MNICTNIVRKQGLKMNNNNTSDNNIELRSMIAIQLKNIGVSKRELAKKAGVSERAAHYFFSGRNNSAKIRMKIIEVLGDNFREQMHNINSSYEILMKLL